MTSSSLFFMIVLSQSLRVCRGGEGHGVSANGRLPVPFQPPDGKTVVGSLSWMSYRLPVQAVLVKRRILICIDTVPKKAAELTD